MVLFAGAELNRLGRRVRDVERTEHPVPERQVDTEVLVEVSGRVTVVNLVLRRAVQHMFDHGPERQPDMAVTQIGRQGIEDQDHVGHAEQGVPADLPAAGVPEDTGKGAEEDGVTQFFDHFFHKVNPACRRWHQDGRGVMDFVERPQIPGMKGAMAPVMDEVLHQKHAEPVEQGQ